MGRSLDAKSIKSAQRVFEVLEYFDADHPEASVTDISRRYGYPQSSASELLTYMTHLGYLRRGTRGRTYQLSMRVAMLGAWVQPQLVRNGRLLRLMDEIAVETGCSTILATNSGVRLQCLHVVRRDDDAPRQGEFIPLLHSAEGHALMLSSERDLVRKYVHRLNSEVMEEGRRVRFDDLATELDGASARGYVRKVDAAGSAFAILLPNADRGEQLALCVRAPAGAHEEAIVRTMRSIVSRTLGLVSIPSAMPPGITSPRQFARLAR
ncbi:MAG: helix-turn-helix domain-containing protein [Flavobacteriaceae bacterium]